LDRRLAYLEALDIPVYVRREAAGAVSVRADVPSEESDGGVAAGTAGGIRPGSSLESLPVTRLVSRGPGHLAGGAGDVVASSGRSADAQAPVEAARSTRISAAGWTDLETAVRGCTACGLCGSRTQTVFGVGDHGARLMVVGEAPGADEDRHGEPFVGRAGQLLNAMLRAAGFDRSQVYIANVLKCRPPGNRDPKPEEAAQCLPYLQRQIELVAPRLILCVGRVAAQNLLDTDLPLGRMRGRTHPFGARAVPVVVTYHPAYLLRTPGDKRKAWADLKFALECMRDGHRPGSAGKT
jgi:uracil-DNA glycosylase family 4